MHKFDRTESQCEDFVGYFVGHFVGDFVGCDVGYGALDGVVNGLGVGLDIGGPFSASNPSKTVIKLLQL